MRVSRQQFEKMADLIVEKNYGGDLSTALAKVAMEESMPPEAIKTLIQMVNTLASLKHLEKADDKSENFGLAEPSKVLKIVFHVDKEDGEGPDMGSPCADHDDYQHAPEVKVASVQDAALEAAKTAADSSVLPTFVRDTASERAFFRKRGLVDHYQSKRAEVQIAYRAGVESLVTSFSYLHGPDHVQFEKDAAALHGDDAVEHLTNVRQAMRKSDEGLSDLVSGEKTASAHRVIDTETAPLRTLTQMLDNGRAFEAITVALDKIANDSLTPR